MFIPNTLENFTFFPNMFLVDAKANENYLYDTSIIEQFPPKPVGGTAGTFTLTASHVSLEPGSISPLLTSFNFYYIVRTFISSVSIYNVKI